jgi:hypothetical protein
MSAAELTGRDPVYWPCEFCRADGGQPCRTARGPIRAVHASRRLAVELWKRYGIGGRTPIQPGRVHEW